MLKDCQGNSGKDMFPSTKSKGARFPPGLEKMVDDLVAAGIYINGAEVIRTGVRKEYELYAKLGLIKKNGGN